MAGSGAVAMGSTLGVEYLVALATHAGPSGALVAMLLGAVVAMMGSMALVGPGVWVKVRMAVFFPVAVGVGFVPGVLVGAHTNVMLAVFVVVMFLAVFVRRFGIPYFFYGFMGWMGYFFASFLHATMAMVPSMLLTVAVATAWVLLLSVTVLNTNPTRTLRRTVRAFAAQTSSVTRACADLLAATDPRQRDRLRRRLRARQAQVAEAALIVEGWSAEPGALPEGRSGAALRRRLIDAQQVLDRLASAAEALAEADPALARLAVRVADRLARRDDTGANRAAHALAEAVEQCDVETEPEGWWPARHFATAALEFVAQVRAMGGSATTALAPADAEASDEFEAVVGLAFGNLPGSPAVAVGVAARGGRWNPLARMSLVTRQAVQVAVAGALAIIAGEALSPTRYYWAVIAAFIMFTGTATRSETFLKGVHRVVGTLFGLVASIWLADVTAGSAAAVLAVVIGSMFCGFYLMRISYAYMIFFLTIMLGQLYSALHEFSAGLLELRLEETAIGAVVGIVVALVVAPLSTRDTVRTARDNLLGTLAELLTEAAERLDGTGPAADLDVLSRSLDDRLRQLALVARPLTRPLLWGNSPPQVRHRLVLYGATTTHARALAVALRTPGDAARPGPAAASRALAAGVTRLIEARPGRGQPDAEGPLCDADRALFATTPAVPGARATDPVLRPLIHLQHLLSELTAPLEHPETAPRALSPAPAESGSPLPATPAAVVAADPVVRSSAVVVGRLAEPDGAPVDGGLVLLTDPAGRAVARTRADRDGRYRIGGCPPGRYLVVATGSGRRPGVSRVELRAGSAHQADFALAPETRRDGPRGTGTVAGTVCGRAAGLPLPDVTVALVDPAGTVVANTTTDELGHYELRDLPAGEYTLVATGAGPAAARATLAPGPRHIAHVTLRPGPATAAVPRPDGSQPDLPSPEIVSH